MAGVVLERADLALWSDVAGTRVVIPRLQVLTPSRRYEQVLVRFEGDTDRTAFRGEGRFRSYQMTARFVEAEHSTLVALLDLFDAAHDDVDGRLLLRTHVGVVSGLNPVEAVVVSEVSSPWSRGLVGDVSFTAETVAYTLEAG